MPRKAPPKAWKKGQSGNLKGRPPKGYSITEMMQEMLKSNPKLKRSIGKRVAEKALKGDMTAIKMIWNYMDGMPPQDITSKGKELNSLYGLFAKHGQSDTEDIPEKS